MVPWGNGGGSRRRKWKRGGGEIFVKGTRALSYSS